MKTTAKNNRNQLIVSMIIFGTVGLFRRSIPLPSSMVACARGIIGTLFLMIYLKVRKRSFDMHAVRKYFPVLFLSGAAIGFNWILLFEAYNYTTVATATLCYYLAPVLVIFGAALFMKESLSGKKIVCTIAALLGMVLVSGVIKNEAFSISEMKGIFCGLGAAFLYASVILMNKKLSDIPALDKTVFQLGFAALALIPYILLTEFGTPIMLSPVSALMLAAMGILHTGIAYLLYFGSMSGLRAHTVALMSYIDPVLAILLSAFVLREPMSLSSATGAVLILGAAYISEKE